MNRFCAIQKFLFSTLLISLFASFAAGQEQAAKPPSPAVVAILPFADRATSGSKRGVQVSDLLFAELAASPKLLLVDREDVEKWRAEQELNLSGLIQPSEAIRAGSLIGARVLVTGSLVTVEQSLFLIVKVISTETSRVFGVSVKGRLDENLDGLVKQLGKEVERTITENSAELIAAPVSRPDQVAALLRQLGERQRPKLWIEVTERHVGLASTDPAAQTEITLLCQQLGFDVLDNKSASREAADVVIQGEGISELATRMGNLVTVKARLEVKAVDRKTGLVLAAERQVSVSVDLAEQIAGKAALQKAADQLAGRLIPKLAR